jgi:hypothetical protein
MDTRYSPPKAAVADIAPENPAPKTRPQQIVLAMRLVIASYVLSLLSLVINWDYFATLGSVTYAVIQQVLTTAIMVWLYWKVFLGRNWARIVVLISTVVGLVVMFSGSTAKLLAAMPLAPKIVMWFGTAVSLVVVWLLFLSPGREWFRKS